MVELKDTVIFHLAKYAPLTPIRPYPHCVKILYEQIKSGEKRSEWREATPYWLRRLCVKGSIVSASDKPVNITGKLKVVRAWFVQGYPKRNLPRLEASIYQLFYHPATQQLEIVFGAVQETTKE